MKLALPSSAFSLLVCVLPIAVGCSSGGFQVAAPADDSGADDASMQDVTSDSGHDALGDTGASTDTATPADSAMDAADSSDTAVDTGTSDSGVTMIDAIVGDTIVTPDGSLCDPAQTPEATTGFFVAPTGSDLGTGTAASPFRTIQSGIAHARSVGRRFVYVAEATYPEALTFDSSSAVMVVGGWTASWTRDCVPGVRDLTTIQSPTPVAVTVVGAPDGAGLRRVTVVAGAAPDAKLDTPGQSSIGVWVQGDGASFTLDDVVVHANVGGDGGDGSDGPPIVVTPMCLGGACSNGMNGGDGGDGTVGMSIGTFGGSAPYTPADGSIGLTATVGAAGSPGSIGKTVSCTACGGNCPALSNCAASTSTLTGATGSCGCGGPPGNPGNPGRGGGASVGLVANGNVTVTIDGAVVSAQNGGRGGDGGAGGKGAPGTPGKNGDTRTCSAGTCAKASSGTGCTCVLGSGSTTATATGGGAGGNGGTGGQAGDGGGGGGGPSFSIVTTGGATVTVDAATTLKFGTGGAEGGSGGGIGKSGSRVDL